MQHDRPLTLQLLLERMRRLYAGTEVVSVRGGERTRAGYAEVADRADRLCSALAALGVGPGDRVATFSWNTREHLEAYLAVPCMGAVLHTLNVRLFADQLEYVVGHAEDQVILVEDSLVPVLEELAPRFDTVRHYVVIGEGDTGSLPDPLRCWPPRSRVTTTPSLTTGRPPASATRAAPPETPRACCIRTARTFCTRWGSAWPTRSGCARMTA